MFMILSRLHILCLQVKFRYELKKKT